MTSYLEHANITVPDIDAAITFLKTVEPALKVRQDARAEQGYRWTHVAFGDSYLALQEPHLDSGSSGMRRPYKDYGVNHLGLVVNDLSAVVERLEAAGYRRGIPGEEHPHRRRAYYHDSADMEWELVEYRSAAEAERFSYE